MGELILRVAEEDDDQKKASISSSTAAFCRICHEGEFESSRKLETPCSCSGTIKFAHRDCIMRWCNEKGDAICEICLQKFEPGYAAIPKKDLEKDSPPVTILRVSVEEEEEEEETISPECASMLHSSVSCCRSLALLCTLLLLMRHTLVLLWQGTEDYPFTLLTLLTLRAAGIVLPMFVLIRIIAVIQNAIRHHQYQFSGHRAMSTHDNGNNVNVNHHHDQQLLIV